MVSSPFSQYNEYIDSARKMANHDKKVWTKRKKVSLQLQSSTRWEVLKQTGEDQDCFIVLLDPNKLVSQYFFHQKLASQKIV